ncbi:MAG: ribosome-associated translation inhibitor RaiA [Planctomycetes bacterium]|nr:ribosome-associated translation inhibitor RaiA [Planctomycetota bacterium]
MEIVVTARDPSITTGMKKHASQKMEKLQRYFDGANHVEVILDREGLQNVVELVITVPRGGTIVCHSRGEDLYAAIDMVIDKAETQLTRFKEKIKDRRGSRRSAPRIAGAEEAEEAEDAEGEPGE